MDSTKKSEIRKLLASVFPSLENTYISIDSYSNTEDKTELIFSALGSTHRLVVCDDGHIIWQGGELDDYPINLSRLKAIREQTEYDAYIICDIMTSGSQYEASLIEQALDSAGFSYYSARLNKTINDKATAHKDGLAERILEADFEQLEKAQLVIVNYLPHAIGSLIELGALVEYNRTHHEQPKRVIVVSSDIRRDTPYTEKGDRCSYSVNALAYGAILFLTDGVGITKLEELEHKLKGIKEL